MTELEAKKAEPKRNSKALDTRSLAFVFVGDEGR